jgi:hypothetical protein
MEPRENAIVAQLSKLVPRERDVISFATATDRSGRGSVLKVVLANGAKERIGLVGTLMAVLSEGLADLSLRMGVPDTGADPLQIEPRTAVIAIFLANMPGFHASDFTFSGQQVPGAITPSGIGLFVAAGETLFIGFDLPDGRKLAYRLPTPLLHVLRHQALEAVRLGAVDLRSVPDERPN